MAGSKSSKSRSGSKTGSRTKSGSGSKTKSTNSTERTIEERFKKMENQHAHVLKRPNMYIGSTKETVNKMWVYDELRDAGAAEFINKDVTYIPALYKIYDEILVNARDHVIRCIEENAAEKCNCIKVEIDSDTGKITVWNNGNGIPVQIHKEHKVYVPTLIFGELLTSENYDDDQKRKVGGQNGLGAKLTNIWSSEFIIETVDANVGKKFYQKFTNNMYKKSEPKITSATGKKSYTQISFIPDFERFKIEKLTSGVIELFKKRVYDVAMNCEGVKVYYNNSLIKTNNITKYISLYFPEGTEFKKILDVNTNPNWKVAVVYDPSDTVPHQVISFVNGINTYHGGTHVDHVVDKLIKQIKSKVMEKTKKTKYDIKPSMIKENLMFFIDCCIINPDFDNQSKERLTTRAVDFGSKYDPPKDFVAKILKSGVVDSIIAHAAARAEANLSKSGKGKSLSSKLYDATHANKRDGTCTLILTEGDSAKTFAMSGLNVIGREKFGVFPLKGKLLNVRDESMKKISLNEEIQQITRIIGLEHKKTYETVKGLRYGRILILTDQDADGSHIKGLIMNFVHFYWPSLVKYEGFLSCLETPLLKATKKGKGKNPEIVPFFNMREFEEWKKENDESKWSLHYYKGLGTSTPQEARECFKFIKEKLILFYWPKPKESDKSSKSKSVKNKKNIIDTDTDIASKTYNPKCKDKCEDAITLAFAKKREDDRKLWLNTYDPNKIVVYDDNRVSIAEFVHNELIAFSVYDTFRSIPNIMDGFKPGQRKVFFAAETKNLYAGKIKVAQFTGYVSENTQYHHGEQSLNDTIVKMAQNFVGSNNINLLLPHGQFGSRLQGGKDAASPRYIFTQLNSICKGIFIKEDFDILQHQQEDNTPIEPVFFAPIIPMILVNGAEGIGTGYSTNIKPVNPRDLFDNIYRFLDGKPMKNVRPWFRNFSGKIEKVADNNYICRANYEIVDDNVIVNDLPIGVWTDNYKEFLNNLLQGKPEKNKSNKSDKTTSPQKKVKGGSKVRGKGKTGKASNTSKVSKTNPIGQDIKTFDDDCTDVRVKFIIKFKPGKLQKYVKKGILEQNLKLVKKLNLNNMHLFDENRKIKKYNSYVEIIENFADVRLDCYQKRKDFLLGKWNKEIDMLKWKLKFVEGVINEEIIIFKKKKTEIEEQLEKLKFPKFKPVKQIKTKLDDEDDTKLSYNYLTSMAIIRFSQDEVKKLRDEIKNKKTEIATLEAKTPNDMWREELDNLVQIYDKWDKEVTDEYNASIKQNKTVRAKAAGSGGRKSKK